MRRRLIPIGWIGFTLFAVCFSGVPHAIHAADALAGASRPKPQLTLKNVEEQYKRVHQFALRLVLLGRMDEARRFLDDYIAAHPADPESHYLMGLLNCGLHDFDKAAEWMKKATDLGLPPERVIAGPRAIVKDAADHPFFSRLTKGQGNRPVHGPLVGNVTDRSASFWIRAASRSSVQIELSDDAGFSKPHSSTTALASEAKDFTAVMHVDGLKPDTKYHYRILVNGERLPSPEAYSFRTFPPMGAKGRFRLAFGGGAGYVPPNERMWDRIRSFDPLLLVLLGDNVYIDDPESIVMQQYTYQRRQSRPEWRGLTARTGVFSIWDDHDFSTNDSWGGPEINAPIWKKEKSWRIFCQNWANPGYGGGQSQPGCWYTFSVGDVDFIMLDCRYYRTDPNLERPSMLGHAQVDWLKRELIRAQGTFKILCSSVPWDFRTKGDSQDTWNGYQAEREAIFGFIESNRIEGVILMSADRHRSDAWKIERKNGYGFYEFNSSRLTNQHVHPEMTEEGAIFSYNKKQSFGLVAFDTEAVDPQITYSVVSIDGEPVHELTVKRSELRFR